MKLENQSCELPTTAHGLQSVPRPPKIVTHGGRSRAIRLRNFSFFVLLLSLLFLRPLADLVALGLASKIHSHILLIPFTFAYLIYLQLDHLPSKSSISIGWSIPPLLIGGGILALAFSLPGFSASANPSNHLALTILAFVCFIAVGGLILLGMGWMRALSFPFAFLIFFVPLPDEIIYRLEIASQLASADAAQAFFAVSGTPILRDGMVFQLPGMVIRVAQECSGIRSSLVLFITSLVAAHMFLKSPWRRFLLVAFVIPLGILRNGFRILVIGLLCVRYGPQMIDSVIHRQGGPVFFVLSLIPLFLLLWWLRRGEAKGAAADERSGL